MKRAALFLTLSLLVCASVLLPVKTTGALLAQRGTSQNRTVPAGFLESTQIVHFVAPSYPPLARQAGIVGQVTLTVNVDKDGSVTNTSESALARPLMAESTPAHPLLVEWAKACIAEWTFEPTRQGTKVTVGFYFGFSGDTRDTNPKTTVKVDFHMNSVRVFITTDATEFVRQ